MMTLPFQLGAQRGRLGFQALGFDDVFEHGHLENIPQWKQQPHQAVTLG